MLTERQLRASAEIAERTGIDMAMIDRLVRTFYGKVRQDEILAPVFNERIADWEPHLVRMGEFWSSVALMTGDYHGRPMQKHLPLPVDARHFDRWLRLFREAAREVCPPVAAAHFIERAERIAQSLEMGIAVSHGVLLTGGRRFHRPDGEVSLPEPRPA
ncbi:MAG TPA: group III truncated hemoglobin [Steroidobacteraceae bacterium]|nr:group III truncated hemoglobin [Steroidobacteraceae bacterium]